MKATKPVMNSEPVISNAIQDRAEERAHVPTRETPCPAKNQR
jgi:hypothetical protein